MTTAEMFISIMQDGEGCDWEAYEQMLPRTPVGTSKYQLKALAKEFDISVRATVQMRLRYLLGELENWCDYIELPIFGVYTPQGTFRLPYADIPAITKEALAITRPDPRAGAITDEMLEQARAFPVDRLLEFKHGKIRCINPEHIDKIATMFHGTKTNTAQCPGCNTHYDSIKIVMTTEDKTFIQAVRDLCNR